MKATSNSIYPRDSNPGGRCAGTVETLKQIAAKLQISAMLWNFSLDPCGGWEKTTADVFVHPITCQELSTAVRNATSNATFMHVTSIEIKAADLVGELPEEIGKLSYLH